MYIYVYINVYIISLFIAIYHCYINLQLRYKFTGLMKPAQIISIITTLGCLERIIHDYHDDRITYLLNVIIYNLLLKIGY